MAAPHDLTALAQAAALRAGEIHPTELAQHYLARIEAHSDTYGAFVTVTPAERPDPLPEHSLAGVPVAIKDNTMTAGIRTTFGSAAFAEYVPTVDADVVVNLRSAGLVSLGKTTTSEFGLSLYSETAIGPPARNPWTPGHTAGGSSGGAAAAVAAGLVPWAQGNDGGGSLRIPASICGLVGYKPTRGLVPSGPLGFGNFGLSTHGPLARTVADAAALLDVLASPAAGEPYLPPPRPARGYQHAATSYRDHLPAGRPLRVGLCLTPLLSDVTPDADVVAAVESVAALLASLGAEVEEVPHPLGSGPEDQFHALWSVLALSPVPADREELLLPLTRWLRAEGRATAPERLIATLSDLQVRVRRGARSATYDVLLSPVLARAQAPVGFFAAAPTPAEDFDRQARFSPYCASSNITGQPAVSLPLGQTADGAPIGVMLAAAPGEDALLLAVSAWLEEARPWAHRHPPVWDQ